MKKKILIIILILVIIFSIPFVYVEVGKRKLYKRTFNYLTNVRGYEKNEFKIENPRHSFINRILSYPEWGIDVVFKDEPTRVYMYTYDLSDNNIIQYGGVNGKHFEAD
ncbi:MAG: DUF3139 domain-containing protein [Firmicutes bacterium]|nr:DUF3139 domain-containing protein [Bacillota bacterium]